MAFYCFLNIYKRNTILLLFNPLFLERRYIEYRDFSLAPSSILSSLQSGTSYRTRDVSPPPTSNYFTLLIGALKYTYTLFTFCFYSIYSLRCMRKGRTGTKAMLNPHPHPPHHQQQQDAVSAATSPPFIGDESNMTVFSTERSLVEPDAAVGCCGSDLGVSDIHIGSPIKPIPKDFPHFPASSTMMMPATNDSSLPPAPASAPQTDRRRMCADFFYPDEAFCTAMAHHLPPAPSTTTVTSGWRNGWPQPQLLSLSSPTCTPSTSMEASDYYFRGAQERALWTQVCREVIFTSTMMGLQADVVRKEGIQRANTTQGNKNRSSTFTTKAITVMRAQIAARVDESVLQAVQRFAERSGISNDARIPTDTAVGPRPARPSTLQSVWGKEAAACHGSWLAARHTGVSTGSPCGGSRRGEKAVTGAPLSSESALLQAQGSRLRQLLYYRAMTNLREVPLTQWTGRHRFLPLSECRAMLAATRLRAAAQHRSSDNSSEQHVEEENGRGPLPHAMEKRMARRAAVGILLDCCPPRYTQPWRYVPALLEDLNTYWRLHRDAEARARLAALKDKDADAFVQHVSVIQITALLSIMERTHAFMHRIGERIAARAAQGSPFPSATDSAAKDGIPVLPAVKAISPVAAPGGGWGAASVSQAYLRFRAYMHSTKDEFRLVHAVDTFVSQPPAALQATLMPHQMDGLRFLASLHANAINGILADEMGVGKTIQTIAFLLYLKEIKKEQGAAIHPHLVLAPLSVVREWNDACHTFVRAGELRVVEFMRLTEDDDDDDATSGGDGATSKPALLKGLSIPEQVRQFDLVLLPIHSARYKQRELTQVQWGYVIVDEAHKAVSNLETMTAQSILQLPYERRLVLTGTPLSSDLRELWSLLYFLNPDIFSDQDSFDAVFQQPFQKYQCKEVCLQEEHQELLILRLHQILRPFMLRRTKKDVCSSLHMTFHEIECPLTHLQQQLLTMLRQQRQLPYYQCAEKESTSSSSSSDAFTSSSDEDEMNEENEGLHGKQKRREKDESAPTSGLPSTTMACGFPSAPLSRNCLGLSSLNVSESTAHALCNHAFMHPFFSQVLTLGYGLSETTQELEAQEKSTSTHTMASAAEHGEGAERLAAPDAPPRSLRGAANMVLACSGKFLLLHMLLLRVVASGHKVVLFTHWLDCMDLLSEYFRSRGWGHRVEVLSGSTNEADRKSRVKRFHSDPECSFFVVSMKAGGCGINLQVAHLILLLDRDYTATNEDQALGRVFRIGQRHTVRAISLTTNDVAERKVVERAAAKNKPRQAIIEEGQYLMTSSTTEGDDAIAEEEQEEEEETAEQRQPSLSSVTKAAPDAEEKEEGEQHNTTKVQHSSIASTALSLLPVCQHIVQLDEQQNTNAPLPPLENAKRLLTSKGWAALRDLMNHIDSLVLTDEDRETRPDLCAAMAATLPPATSAAFEEAWAREECGAVSSPVGSTKEEVNGLALASIPLFDRPAHTWAHVVTLLGASVQGPALLRDALQMAVDASEYREDPAARRLAREQRAEAAAGEMRLLLLDPPQSFIDRCLVEGITEERYILKRFAREQRAKEKAKAAREASRNAKPSAGAPRATKQRPTKKTAVSDAPHVEAEATGIPSPKSDPASTATARGKRPRECHEDDPPPLETTSEKAEESSTGGKCTSRKEACPKSKSHSSKKKKKAKKHFHRTAIYLFILAATQNFFFCTNSQRTHQQIFFFLLSGAAVVFSFPSNSVSLFDVLPNYFLIIPQLQAFTPLVLPLHIPSGSFTLRQMDETQPIDIDELPQVLRGRIRPRHKLSSSTADISTSGPRARSGSPLPRYQRDGRKSDERGRDTNVLPNLKHPLSKPYSDKDDVEDPQARMALQPTAVLDRPEESPGGSLSSNDFDILAYPTPSSTEREAPSTAKISDRWATAAPSRSGAEKGDLDDRGWRSPSARSSTGPAPQKPPTPPLSDTAQEQTHDTQQKASERASIPSSQPHGGGIRFRSGPAEEEEETAPPAAGRGSMLGATPESGPGAMVAGTSQLPRPHLADDEAGSLTGERDRDTLGRLLHLVPEDISPPRQGMTNDSEMLFAETLGIQDLPFTESLPLVPPPPPPPAQSNRPEEEDLAETMDDGCAKGAVVPLTPPIRPATLRHAYPSPLRDTIRPGGGGTEAPHPPTSPQHTLAEASSSAASRDAPCTTAATVVGGVGGGDGGEIQPSPPLAPIPSGTPKDPLLSPERADAEEVEGITAKLQELENHWPPTFDKGENKPSEWRERGSTPEATSATAGRAGRPRKTADPVEDSNDKKKGATAAKKSRKSAGPSSKRSGTSSTTANTTSAANANAAAIVLLKAGMKVEGRWGRNWYAAEVVEDQRGNYVQIRWAADQSVLHLKRREVRLLPGAPIADSPQKIEEQLPKKAVDTTKPPAPPPTRALLLDDDGEEENAREGQGEGEAEAVASPPPPPQPGGGLSPASPGAPTTPGRSSQKRRRDQTDDSHEAGTTKEAPRRPIDHACANPTLPPLHQDGAPPSSPQRKSRSDVPALLPAPGLHWWADHYYHRNAQPICCFLTEMARVELEASPELVDSFTHFVQRRGGNPRPLTPVRVIASLRALAELDDSVTLFFFVSSAEYRRRGALMTDAGPSFPSSSASSSVAVSPPQKKAAYEPFGHTAPLGSAAAAGAVSPSPWRPPLATPAEFAAGINEVSIPPFTLAYCLGVTPLCIQSLRLLSVPENGRTGKVFPQQVMRSYRPPQGAQDTDTSTPSPAAASGSVTCCYHPLPAALRLLGDEQVALLRAVSPAGQSPQKQQEGAGEGREHTAASAGDTDPYLELVVRLCGGRLVHFPSPGPAGRSACLEDTQSSSFGFYYAPPHPPPMLDVQWLRGKLMEHCFYFTQLQGQLLATAEPPLVAAVGGAKKEVGDEPIHEDNSHSLPAPPTVTLTAAGPRSTVATPPSLPYQGRYLSPAPRLRELLQQQVQTVAGMPPPTPMAAQQLHRFLHGAPSPHSPVISAAERLARASHEPTQPIPPPATAQQLPDREQAPAADDREAKEEEDWILCTDTLAGPPEWSCDALPEVTRGEDYYVRLHPQRRPPPEQPQESAPAILRLGRVLEVRESPRRQYSAAPMARTPVPAIPAAPQERRVVLALYEVKGSFLQCLPGSSTNWRGGRGEKEPEASSSVSRGVGAVYTQHLVRLSRREVVEVGVSQLLFHEPVYVMGPLVTTTCVCAGRGVETRAAPPQA
eukprot:gene5881-4200_t